jgi:outer membrane protein assembly factor BamD (BamD/ComL family)
MVLINFLFPIFNKGKKMKRLKNILLLTAILFSSVYATDYNRFNLSVQESYSNATKALQDKRWDDVIYFSSIINKNFADSSFAKDAIFYQGVAYYNIREYEMADKFFSSYLKDQVNQKYFQDIITYKFEIAEKFFAGEKKHLFGVKKLPRLFKAKDEALALYEEVIQAMPRSDMATQSLYAKGLILSGFEEWDDGIETLNQLITSFPKHELSSHAFLHMQKIYLNKASPKQQDSDLLDMAELNLQRFELAFPVDDKLDEAKEVFNQMKEKYATGLFEIGQFFERTKKINASVIYYSKIISAFPSTKSASLSSKRLEYLKNKKLI